MSHYAVVDLEMCRIPKKYRTPDYKLDEHYLPHPEHLSFSFGDKLAGLNLASIA